ncbi:MAG: O-antigen ligase family protein [Armatimonadota bacterium]
MQSTEHPRQQASDPGTLTVTPMPPALQRFAQGVIVALLLVAPLLFMPPNGWLFNSLDTPRRLVLQLGAGLLAGLIVMSWAQRGRLVLRWQALDLPVILLLLAGIVSGIAGAYPRITFFGPIWCEDSLMLLGTGIFLYLGIKEFIRTRDDIERMAFLVALVGGIVALLGFADHFDKLGGWRFNFHFSGKRLISTLGNSMFTGTYLAMLIPLALGVLLETKSVSRRVIMFLVLLLLPPALGLTLARAAWVGFFLGMLVMLGISLWYLARGKVEGTTRLWLTGGLLASLLVLGITAMHPSVNARFVSLLRRDPATLKTRAVYMETSWRMFLARPISGWGVGNLRMIYPQYRPSSLVIEQNLPLNRGYNTSFPHNILLQIAAEMGLLGLIAFLLLLFLLYRSGFRALARAPWLSIGLLGMLSAYLVTNMFAFDNSATMATFWIGLALLAALTAEDRALPAKYGSLAEPLTGRVPELLNICSLVILIGMSLHVLAQTWVSYISERGVLKAEMMSRYMERDPAKAIGLIEAAIKDQEYALGKKVEVREDRTRWTPLWTRVFSPVPDYQQAQNLALCYRAEMNSLYRIALRFQELGDPQKTAKYFFLARNYRIKFLLASRETLEMVDRTPIVLRYMIMELARARDFEKPEGAAAQIDEGKRLAQRLVKFEPRSAEVRLMAAEVLAAANDFEEAMKHAMNGIRLDPGFADAYAMLAHYQFQLVKAQDPRKLQFLNESIANFTEATRRGVQLNPEHRLEYAFALFIVRRDAAGVEQGRGLQGTPLLDALINDLKDIYKYLIAHASNPQQQRQLQEKLGQLIAQLKAGAPAPLPPSPAAPRQSSRRQQDAIPRLPWQR